MSLVQGTLTGDAQVVARIGSLSARLRQQIVDDMRRLWFGLQAAVITEKLSGDPLHRRTGNLASSINVGGSQSTSEFIEGQDEIVGRVGTNDRYGKLHEYGGTFAVPAHERQITMVFGRPVTPHAVLVKAHNVTFPERSFLRSTLRDRSSQIRATLAKSVTLQ